MHSKKTRRNSVNENLSRIRRNTSPKNVGKMKQNVDSRRLTPKLVKLTRYSILKIQSQENMERDLKISKQVWQTGGLSYK